MLFELLLFLIFLFTVLFNNFFTYFLKHKIIFILLKAIFLMYKSSNKVTASILVKVNLLFLVLRFNKRNFYLTVNINWVLFNRKKGTDKIFDRNVTVVCRLLNIFVYYKLSNFWLNFFIDSKRKIKNSKHKGEIRA